MHLVRKRQLIISLLLIAGIYSQAYSQLFFTGGSIILGSGDTLTGEIRERSNQLITFRPKPDSPAQDYTPEQINAYYTEKGNTLSVALTEDGRQTRYFMHEQIKGHVSLYNLFKPEGRLTHAIRLPDKTFAPLRGSLALATLTNHLTACTDGNFTRLLNPQSFYNSNSQFEHIVNAYNECVNPGQSSKRPKKPIRYEVGFLVGAVQNSWKYFSPNDPYWHPGGAYAPNYTGAFGGFFTLFPRKRLSVGAEILFTQCKASKTVFIDNPLDPIDKRSRFYTFSESYFALPLTGRYVFSKGSVRWYLKGGVVPTLDRTIEGHVTGINVDADISIQADLSVGYLAGLGADILFGQKRHVYIEVRTMPHIVQEGATHMANSRSVQLMASIPLINH